MLKPLLRRSLSSLRWALCAVGALAVVVTALVADELMLADKYAPAVHAVAPAVDVKLIDGVNHMGIVSVPKAVSVIADDVATRGAAGS